MRWESSGVVGFDLGPLLEGQMRTARLKSAYNSLIIGHRGFGALSLRWIQFASVLRCARSSLIYSSDHLRQKHIKYIHETLAVSQYLAGVFTVMQRQFFYFAPVSKNIIYDTLVRFCAII